MRLAYPEIQHVFDTDIPKVPTIVIENRHLLFRLLDDLSQQCLGNSGTAILSNGKKPLEIAKNLDLISTFFPFEVNSRALLTKLTNELSRKAVSPEWFLQTQTLLSTIENYISSLAFSLDAQVEIAKLDISTLIKSVSPRFPEDYQSLQEKILGYMELSDNFFGERLYVFVHLRSYLYDEEAAELMNSVIDHEYNALFIDSYAYPLLPFEERWTIDKDLCEF